MKNNKILVVDDSENNRELIVDFLKFSGYICIEAENGEEAVRLARKEEPCVILMDIQMPIMDGFKATKLIKLHESTKHIPVIFITAFATTDTKEKCIELGAVDFLSKPIHIKELLVIVKKHCPVQ